MISMSVITKSQYDRNPVSPGHLISYKLLAFFPFRGKLPNWARGLFSLFTLGSLVRVEFGKENGANHPVLLSLC